MSAVQRFVLVGVLIAVAVLLGASLLTVTTQANDESQYFCYTQNGTDDPADMTTWFNWRGIYADHTELLDSELYVASMDAVGKSEKIAADAQVCKVTVHGATPTDPANAGQIQIVQNQGVGDLTIEEAKQSVGNGIIYRLKLNDELIVNYDVSVGGSYAVPDCPGAVINPNWADIPGKLLTTLVGTETGVLTVDAYQFIVDLTMNDGYHLFAHDEAKIESGLGACTLDSPAGRPAKPGEELTFKCDLGYASGVGSGTWKIFGSWQEGSALVDLGPGPAINKLVRFNAPMDSGMHQIRLFNSLFGKDAWYFTVTVNPEQAPPVPSVSTNPNAPWVTGTEVTLTWSAEPNAETQSPIKQVHVDVFYVNGESLGVGGTFIGSSGTLSFIVGKSVDIRVAIVSEDANGEFSLPRQPTYQTESCDLFAKCEGDFDLGGISLLAIMLLVVGIILIIVAIFVGWPIFLRVLFTIVGFFMILIALLSFAGVL